MTVVAATETGWNTIWFYNKFKIIVYACWNSFLDNLINIHEARNIMTEIKLYTHVLEIYLECPFENLPNTST